MTILQTLARRAYLRSRQLSASHIKQCSPRLRSTLPGPTLHAILQL